MSVSGSFVFATINRSPTGESANKHKIGSVPAWRTTQPLVCFGLRKLFSTTRSTRFLLTLALFDLFLAFGFVTVKTTMCRNIKPLFNFDPPVTPEEILAASLQFVRKISGFNKPSKANEASFLAAVDGIAVVSASLLRALETNTLPKNREEEAAKAKARAAHSPRFRN